jgi:hypothetical protein
VRLTPEIIEAALRRGAVNAAALDKRMRRVFTLTARQAALILTAIAALLPFACATPPSPRTIAEETLAVDAACIVGGALAASPAEQQACADARAIIASQAVKAVASMSAALVSCPVPAASSR